MTGKTQLTAPETHWRSSDFPPNRRLKFELFLTPKPQLSEGSTGFLGHRYPGAIRPWRRVISELKARVNSAKRRRPRFRQTARPDVKVRGGRVLDFSDRRCERRRCRKSASPPASLFPGARTSSIKPPKPHDPVVLRRSHFIRSRWPVIQRFGPRSGSTRTAPGDQKRPAGTRVTPQPFPRGRTKMRNRPNHPGRSCQWGKGER
jgi:hypothetical protein